MINVTKGDDLFQVFNTVAALPMVECKEYTDKLYNDLQKEFINAIEEAMLAASSCNTVKAAELAGKLAKQMDDISNKFRPEVLIPELTKIFEDGYGKVLSTTDAAFIGSLAMQSYTARDKFLRTAMTQTNAIFK